jgi:hypothetical protein
MSELNSSLRKTAMQLSGLPLAVGEKVLTKS